MRLLDLRSDLWDQYPGAYGSVRQEVAVLMGEAPPAPQEPLRRLDPEERSAERTAFGNLCEGLSHQMSFYRALYPVLPYMVKFLGQKAGDFQWQLLILSEIGLCLATDTPWEHEGERDAAPELLESYQEAAGVLAQRAERFLKENLKKLRQEEVFERRRFCLGLYALLGDRREAFAMVMNRFETCYVQCGSCGYLDEDLELIDGRQRRKIRPVRFWQRKKPERFRQFRRILHQLGDWEGEELLACYYGVYTCPRCGRQEHVMEGLTAAFDPDITPSAPPKDNHPSAAPSEARPKKPAPKQKPEPPEVLEDNALLRAAALCREPYPEALALLDKGAYQEALDWCARRLEETPDWRLHVLRARCYKALSKTPELDRCLTAALELDPDNVLVLRARCPTVSTTNRYRRHVQDLTRLMELDPENAGAYLVNRAYRLHWTGDDEGARRDLQAAAARPEGKALQGSPDFRRLWKELFPEDGTS